MRIPNFWKSLAITMALSFAALSSGCTFDVKLAATPDAVQIGQSVNLEVTVTNRSNCPVGIPTAILLPLVPKDHLISKIEDDEFREFLSEAVDDFCSEGDLFEPPPGAEASCDFANGDLLCTMTGFGDLPVAPQANVPLNGGSDEPEVNCESDGSTITCRVPSKLLEMAQEAGEQPQEGILDKLLCLPAGPFGFCIGAGLLPGGSASGSLELVVEEPGIYRNWVVAFPKVSGGVCSEKIPNIPCDPDGPPCELPIVGSLGECLEGICISGDDDDDAAPSGDGSGALGFELSPVGFGCVPGGLGQGGGGAKPVIGECTVCQECNKGLEVDIACTTVTASFSAPAPAMSTLGLAVMALALFAVAAAGLRRVRVRRQV